MMSFLSAMAVVSRPMVAGSLTRQRLCRTPKSSVTSTSDRNSLVEVVAVGNDELLVGHGGGEQADGCRVADAPEAVQDAEIVSDFNVRSEQSRRGGGRRQ